MKDPSSIPYEVAKAGMKLPLGTNLYFIFQINTLVLAMRFVNHFDLDFGVNSGNLCIAPIFHVTSK